MGPKLNIDFLDMQAISRIIGKTTEYSTRKALMEISSLIVADREEWGID